MGARIAGVLVVSVLAAACAGNADVAPASAPGSTAAPVPSTVSTLAPPEAFCTEPGPGEVIADDPAALPNPNGPDERADGRYAPFDVRDGPESAYAPCFVPAADSPFENETVVIGVAIDGDARAYAIGQLVGHFVNDRFDDDPLLVSY